MARKRDRAARGTTHPCATTTPSLRRLIQASEENNTVLAARLGLNRKTTAKWRARDSTSDQRMGPKNPGSKLLSRRDEAIILAYRWRTRLALDDCLVRLKRQMPHLSRSALYWCLKRWGLNNIRPTAASPTLTSRALAGPFCFDIAAIEVAFHDDVFGLAFEVFLAVEEVTKDVYAEASVATPEKAAAFLANLVAQSPQKIIAVTTNTLPLFADWVGTFDEDLAAVSSHPFAVVCRANRIKHTPTLAPYQKPVEPKGPFPYVEIR